MCLSCAWPLALLLCSFHWWFHKSDFFSHHLNLKHSLLWCHDFSFTLCTCRTRWYSVIKHLKNKLQLSKPQNNSITRMPICWWRKELMCFALNHSFICICWNYNLINRRNLCACHYYTYMEGEKNNSWGPSPLTRTAEQWLSALLCGNGKPLRAVGGVRNKRRRQEPQPRGFGRAPTTGLWQCDVTFLSGTKCSSLKEDDDSAWIASHLSTTNLWKQLFSTCVLWLYTITIVGQF